MVVANYNFLTEVLENLGFKNGLFNDRLKSAMEMGLPKIELKAMMEKKVGNFTFNVVLEKGDGKNLSSDQERFWFANKIEVTYKKHGEETPKQHTFGLYKQKGLPVEQMINLMKGNYVHASYRSTKTGQMVNKWQYVDFRSFNKNGEHPLNSIYDDRIQWNITKELSALPHINGMTQEMKEDLLRALRNGDDVAVSLRVNGKKEDLYLKANPRSAQIDVFNGEGEKVVLTKPSFQLMEEHSTKEDLAMGAMTLASTEKVNKEEPAKNLAKEEKKGKGASIK
ncbi:hypothetical protein [Chitinophaga varians]|uniref:hypothetical protein n=1 Tax=Chitinophaga varians TaxID=2202339 RepID=UPI00165F02A4|nr:hypothetical protein [Chitinophaga varians]MBC9909112.1 hypothetical protein [Chitinophaga varians]